MREIKFRAWDVEHHKMLSPEDLWGKFGLIPDRGLFQSWETGEIFDSNLANKLINHMIPLQYTGLKDKNGKEIYEGDIVQDKVNQCIWRYVIKAVSFAGNNLYAVCIWRNFEVIDGETIMGNYPQQSGSWNYISSTVEVIGNIYENPELLKGDK